MAILCTTIIGSIAYVLFRLPFGSSPAPGNFCLVSEFVIDLAQLIATDATWDPAKLFNPNRDKIPKPEHKYADNHPFTVARPLAIDVKLQTIFIDGFIDDIVTITVKMHDLLSRATNVVPLAIHSIFRPVDDDEPILRDDVLSARKMQGEGAMSEIKLILGWVIDSRKFTVSLAPDKECHWQHNLDTLITKGTNKTPVKTKELESVIGKLNHTSYLFTEGRFLLSRLRRRLRLCKRYNQRRLQPEEMDDLRFWKIILRHMRDKGRNINHITFGIPQLYCISDASKFGIGGWNSEGYAWRWELPPHMRGFFSINVLELIAARITLRLTLDWLQADETCPTGIKIHCLTDNSSALSWMRKSCFDPSDGTPHDKIARTLTMDLLHFDCSLFLSHIPGKQNIIADSLSRDFHLTSGSLLKELYRNYGAQMPKTFKICELKDPIISWISSIKPSVPLEKGSDIQRNKSSLGLGASGAHLSNHRALETAFWSKEPDKKKLVSSLLSRSRSDITTLGEQLCLPLGEIQSEQPSTKWARPSGRMVIPTLPTTL